MYSKRFSSARIKVREQAITFPQPVLTNYVSIAEVDILYTEYFGMARMIGTWLSLSLYFRADRNTIANYMFDLDKELDLQMFSNKHTLPSEDHRKHKKKKKVKTAPERAPAE